MSSDDVNDRARQIGADIEKADARRRADAEGDGDLAKVLEALQGISGRMDAMEAAAKSAKPEPKADEDDDEELPDPKDEDNQSLGAVQARADAVYRHFGMQAAMPLSGETPLRYRRRLLTHLKQHSEEWSKADVTQLKGELLNIAERKIYADSIAASGRPLAPEGELIERVHVDPHTGSRRIEFFGNPRAWMEAFSQVPQRARIARPNRQW